MNVLEIKDLKASIDGQFILNGINLSIQAGEVHAIMGPNGSGKSTLSKVIAGHPSYEVVSGSVEYEVNFEKIDLLSLPPFERARQGIFLAFQYPIEVPGVSNFEMLHQCYNQVVSAQGAAEMDADQFRAFVMSKLQLVEFKPEFLDRPCNVGFSGGEKKKNEILQMAVLSPRVSFLDETDSGLDIDSLRVVANGVNRLKSKDSATVVITHYQRLLDYIKPDFVHVLYKGRIVRSGDFSLAQDLEKRGYDWLIQDVHA